MPCLTHCLLGLLWESNMNEAFEVWKDIVGYEGVYQVSSLGRVRSLDRTKKDRWGNNVPLSGRILKQKLNRGGYYCVHLRTNKESHPTVHRLVALTFIDNPENKETVNHKDGCKTNNAVENLEWATISENTKHAIENGLYTPPNIKEHTRYGTDAHSCKLTEDDIIQIRKLRCEGLTYNAISKIYKIGITQVSRICKFQSWSWLK